MKLRYGLRVPALFLVLAAAPLMAQEVTGLISGTVFDSSGGVIPGAAVSIENAATRVIAWSGLTNDAGLYVGAALPVGQYNVSVEAPGFKRQQIENVSLRLNHRVRVDVTLGPGEVLETVRVSGESAGQLEVDNSSLGTAINTSQVTNFALPNRNILSLLMLVPGVSGGGTASNVSASTLTINGSRVSNQEFMVDGVSVVSNSTGNLVRMPSTESIREFKVLTSAYSAEYGRTAGPTIALTVQSGTKQYHGGVYEYFRNEKLNANNFFRNLRGEARPVDRRHQFGAKFGGPVYIPKLYNGRGRTFFFFTYEGTRSIAPFSNAATIPDERFRLGDFSASPIRINDPVTRAPFLNNTIPTSRIDPAAAKYMSLLPASNAAGTVDAQNGRRTFQLPEHRLQQAGRERLYDTRGPSPKEIRSPSVIRTSGCPP